MALSPRLFRALGWSALILAGFAAVFTPLALLEGESDAARGFFLTAVAGGFAGGVAVAGTRGVTSSAGASAALRLALFGWLIMPLLAAAPLVTAEGSLTVGVFEAYSAMTTTGAILTAPEDLPRSLVLWRCVIAWLGGLASLVLAATVFAALDRRGVGLRRTSLLTVERSDLFTNFGRAVRRLGLAYALVTGLGLLGLLLSGAGAFNALCLALSGIATAGLQPFSGGLSAGLNASGVVVLAALCLLGAWNMAVQYEALTRLRTTRGSGEMRAMLVLALGLGLLFGLTGGAALFAPAAFEALFALTTSGFQIGEAPVVPPVALVLLALLGGSTISTAGGIKMPRILLLMRRAGGELSVLSHPSAAVRTRYAGRSVSDEALAGVWVYALAYPVALAIGAVLIGLGGADFESAWLLSGAALTNAGPVAGGLWADQSAASLGAAGLLMVAGRLEVLAAAAAIYVMLARD
jgi:trk system potassium uptake protein TrkH